MQKKINKYFITTQSKPVSQVQNKQKISSSPIFNCESNTNSQESLFYSSYKDVTFTEDEEIQSPPGSKILEKKYKLDEKQNKMNSSYKYQDSWTILHPWLLYEQKEKDIEKKLYCKLCIDYQQIQRDMYENKQISVFDIIQNKFIEGCSRIKIQSIQDHTQISSHKKAFSHLSQKSKVTPINIFQQQVRKNIKDEEIKPLFVAQYFIAKKKISFDNYVELVLSYKTLNVKCLDNYLNNTYGHEIMRSIYNVIDQQFIEAIQLKKYPVSLSFDTKTNRTNQKLLAIAIRYIDAQYQVKETFFYIGELNYKNAQEIFDGLLLLLKQYNILNQLVFVSTDGEKTLSSTKNGVIGKLTNIIPYLQAVHCRAHCANLGYSDCLAIYPYLQEFNKIVFKLCCFFNSNKSNSLTILLNAQEEIQLGLIEEQQISSQNKFIPKGLKKPLDIRWLSYLPAIKSIKEKYEAICKSLVEINNKKSLKLHTKIIDLSFIYFLEIHIDILEELNHFIKDLQKKTLDLDMLQRSFNLCQLGLINKKDQLAAKNQIFIEDLLEENGFIYYSKIQLYKSNNHAIELKKLNNITKLCSNIIDTLNDSLISRVNLKDQIAKFEIFSINKIKKTIIQILWQKIWKKKEMSNYLL